jgi:hypothetical protein
MTSNKEMISKTMKKKAMLIGDPVVSTTIATLTLRPTEEEEPPQATEALGAASQTLTMIDPSIKTAINKKILDFPEVVPASHHRASTSRKVVMTQALLQTLQACLSQTFLQTTVTKT